MTLRKKPGIATWAAALAFLTLSIFASQVQAQDTRSVTLRSLSGAAIGSYNEGSFYVGPYGFQVGSDPGSSLWDFYCVDFSRAVYKDQTFTAHFTSMAGGDLTNTYKGVLATYQQAAYLTKKFDELPQDQWGALHAAIWKVTGVAPTGGDASDPLVDDWVSEAEANYGSVNSEYWTVVSDVDGNRQEFLTYTAPEPTSMLLLGTGLAGVAWFRRRRDGEVEIEGDDELA